MSHPEKLSFQGRKLLDRRNFLHTAGLSTAGIALTSMLAADGLLAEDKPLTAGGKSPGNRIAGTQAGWCVNRTGRRMNLNIYSRVLLLPVVAALLVSQLVFSFYTPPGGAWWLLVIQRLFAVLAKLHPPT